MYTAISILRHHIYKATEFGADFNELCRRTKVTPEILSNGEAHHPYTPGEENDFWTHALALTGNPCLGLHMGQKSDKYNPFGVLGLLAGTSRTVGEALQMVSRYNDTLTVVFRYNLDLSGEHAVFEMTPHPLWEETNLESARQAVDMSIAGWLTELNEGCTRRIYPIRTELKYGRRFEEEYQKVVKGPVLFNMPANRFIFHKGDMDIPLINHDRSLFTTFDSLLQQKEKQLEVQKSISSQVRHLLMTKFHGQIVHIDIVASTMFMTARTLQRRLSDESTSFRAICIDVRKNLAVKLIKTGKVNKTRVASFLGYADFNAFNKAYRSWD
jgi:AraC-like DNA-binding protein